MTEKKPTPPIVYVALTVVAIGAIALAWNTYTETTRVNPEQQEAIDKLNEATENLRRVQEEQKKK